MSHLYTNILRALNSFVNYEFMISRKNIVKCHFISVKSIKIIEKVTL